MRATPIWPRPPTPRRRSATTRPRSTDVRQQALRQRAGVRHRRPRRHDDLRRARDRRRADHLRGGDARRSARSTATDKFDAVDAVDEPARRISGGDRRQGRGRARLARPRRSPISISSTRRRAREIVAENGNRRERRGGRRRVQGPVPRGAAGHRRGRLRRLGQGAGRSTSQPARCSTRFMAEGRGAPSSAFSIHRHRPRTRSAPGYRGSLEISFSGRRRTPARPDRPARTASSMNGTSCRPGCRRFREPSVPRPR